MISPLLSRRDFLKRSSLAAGALALGGAHPALAATTPAPVLGKAEHCLFIWLGGGMSQIDTFDPKPTMGDATQGSKKPGSYYPSIDTAVPGLKVCEHLPLIAQRYEHFIPVRTVNHNVIDEHAAATNRMHTGRPVSGSVVYPSIGSIIAHQRKAMSEEIPPYVLIGYPSATRGPGFLGPKAGYVYLTDTESGPAGLTRPRDISLERQARREALLNGVRGGFIKQHATEAAVRDYVDAMDESFRMQRGDFMRAFQLNEEPGSLRSTYGDEVGQRCLLARRLVERGVRFVEIGFNLNFVNGAGWDTHNKAQLDQWKLIRQLDRAVSTLVDDLKGRHLLDKTLIVIAGEFGRPAGFDGGGGRGHYGKCFTVVMAGGGLRTGQAVGESDDLAMNAVSDPVSVPDLFATILAATGVNPHKNLYDGDRPVPITEGGRPISKLFV